MENNKKEKAINHILLGLALQFGPSITLVLYVKYLDSLFAISGILIFFIILGLGFFLVGYGFFIKGCRLYIKSKGYSYNWGWLGLLSSFGLSILLLIPSKINGISLQNESLTNEPFDKINIPELFLYLIIGLQAPLLPILGIFCLLNNLDFFATLEKPPILFGIVTSVFGGLILLKKSQKAGLIFDKIMGYKNHINLKLLAIVFPITFAFIYGSNDLTLYHLSFILPKYVEEHLNEKVYTNISEMILWSFSVMLLAPLIEEFFFRGIILQKWAIKWGVKAGILTSSLLFTIIHFRFDIISLFLAGIILSILYFKTRCLITSMLFHFFYNATYTILSIIDYFSTSKIERGAFVSIKDYQASIQPLLSQRVFLIAISLPFLIYFIYNNFPKNDAIIPYYINDAKSCETN